MEDGMSDNQQSSPATSRLPKAGRPGHIAGRLPRAERAA